MLLLLDEPTDISSHNYSKSIFLLQKSSQFDNRWVKEYSTFSSLISPVSQLISFFPLIKYLVACGVLTKVASIQPHLYRIWSIPVGFPHQPRFTLFEITFITIWCAPHISINSGFKNRLEVVSTTFCIKSTIICALLLFFLEDDLTIILSYLLQSWDTLSS